MAAVACLMACLVAAAAAQQDLECRVCPEGCLAVPRSDGSCPVCICDGVALTDCAPPPTECLEGCQLDRGAEGCLECLCLPGDTTLCPALAACPEECQQPASDGGCLECVCDVPEPFCPPIDCPEDCTRVEQEDSCPTCRCDPPRVCPAIPECLRGCIERDQERDCYICNCEMPPSQPPEQEAAPPGPDNPSPPDQTPADPGIDEGLADEPDRADTDPPQPVRPVDPEGDGRPASERRCRNQRNECPAGCRMGVTRQGCRECYCGTDAMICPGVQRCNSRCLFRSPVNGCCRCQCPRRPGSPDLTIAWNRFTSVSPQRVFPFGPPRGWLLGPPFVRGVFP